MKLANVALVFTLGLAALPAAAQVAKPRLPDRETLLKRANDALSAGKRAEAAGLLKAAADRFQSVRALLLLARLQSGTGDAKGALESLRQARELAPNSEDVLSSYAQLALAARLPLQAVLALEPLTRMCPSVAQYHYLRGIALMQAGDVLAAAVSLEEAERLEPSKLLTLLALGMAQNTQKSYGAARGYLERALALEPDNLEVTAALAEAEEGQGELEAAEGHAQRVVASAADHVTANVVMGMVRMKQERFEEARDFLERAVAAEPTSQKAHYQLSLAYARLGETAASQKHLELYQQARKDFEERLIKLRTATGVGGDGGMQP